MNLLFLRKVLIVIFIIIVLGIIKCTNHEAIINDIINQKIDSVSTVRHSDFIETTYYVGVYSIYVGEEGIFPLRFNPGYEIRVRKSDEGINIGDNTDIIINYLKDKKNYEN